MGSGSTSFSILLAQVTGVIKLTDSDGTEQLNFASGSTLYIKVTDADRNTSSSSAQTFTATVKSEKETTAESVIPG